MTTEELEVWKRLNECEAVKKVFGGLQPGDRYYCIMNDDYGTQSDAMGVCDVTCDIWLPPFFDPIRPQRSLLWMIDANQWHVELFSSSIIYLRRDKDDLIIKDRTDLALAKAIIEQEVE